MTGLLSILTAFMSFVFLLFFVCVCVLLRVLFLGGLRVSGSLLGQCVCFLRDKHKGSDAELAQGEEPDNPSPAQYEVTHAMDTHAHWQ